MKLRVLPIAALLTVLVSGCSFTQTSIDALIKPPTLSKEQQEIYAALKRNLEGDKSISLIYPKDGDYRSPYIIENLDDEESSEAIVFYRLSNSTANSGGALNVNILDQKDGEWRSAWVTKELDVSEIQKVSILSVDGKKLIVVGFKLTSDSINTRDATDTVDPLNSQTFNVFEYQDGQLNLLASERCMGYEVYDMDGDGKEEIVALKKDTDVQSHSDRIAATVYHYQDGTYAGTQETLMEATTTEFTNFGKGLLTTGEPALYVDGVHGNETFTEVLTIRDGQLANLTYSTYRSLYQKTARLSGLASMDLDKDQVFEIPKNEGFPGYADSQFYRITWQTLEDGELTVKAQTYTDYTFDYYLELPERWGNAVTAKKDSVNNEITFYLYNTGDVKDDSAPLLKIRTFTPSNLTNGELPMGYTELETNGQFVYGYALTAQGVDYDLTNQEVLDLFHLL